MSFISKIHASKHDKVAHIVHVNRARCPGGHSCPSLRVCPTGALHQTGMNVPEVDPDTCIGCARCTSFCPRGALTFSR